MHDAFVIPSIERKEDEGVSVFDALCWRLFLKKKQLLTDTMVETHSQALAISVSSGQMP